MLLTVAAMLVVGCGGDGLGTASKPDLAPTSAPPSFVRITVTPIPTSTATPTPTPQVFEINAGPPMFPMELDPEIVEERPEDEVIFEGWTKFLTNTMMVNPNAEDGSSVHFCANKLILDDQGSTGNVADWRVARSPAISFLDWGAIAVQVDIVGGRWAGREWDMLTLVRRMGKVFVTNNPQPGEIIIERSELCLARL